MTLSSRFDFTPDRFSPRRLRFLLGLFLGLAAAERAAALETVVGTVTNAATGQNLEGARVVLQGTNREALTDSLGVYRFDDVPAGPVTLAVSYTGLKSADVTVEVSPGRINRRDVGLTSDIYQMGKFVVAGEREGQAQAITLQRNSDGIKSIVAADVFGGLAGNPAELVAKLPGIEGESVGGDIRYIRVRGLNQNLNSITMDGNRIADAASAGTTREFQFQTIGSDAIERIEVTKLPTPDMDGDSIGGNVNLVTKSAFDSSPERRIRGSIGTIWRATDDRDKIRPNYSLSYSEVFGGRIGVTLNAAYRPHYSIAEQTTQQHQQLATGPLVGPAYTFNYDFVDFRNLRKRSSVALKLDYKFSDTTRFYVNGQLNKHVEHESDTEAMFVTNQGIATRDAAGNLTGTNGIVPGFTDTITEVRPVPSSVVTLRSTNLYKDGKTQNVQVGGVHRWSRLHVDYDGYESVSKANYAGTSEPDFIARGTMGWRIDRTENAFLPQLTQTAGPDWTNINSFTEDAYNITRRAAWDNYRGASLNATQSFVWPLPSYLKAGLRWREQTRRNVSTPYSGTFVGADGVMGLNPATGRNDDNLAQFMSQRPLPGNLARYPHFPFPNVVGEAPSFWDVLQQHPDQMRENLATDLQNELRANTMFTEDIRSCYLMGNMKLGPLSLLTGVRVEQTCVDGVGSLQNISPEERARRAAFTGSLTDAEIRRRTIAEFGNRQTRTGSYRNVLPGVHLKYSPLPNLVTRFGYAANVGRPGIGQLVPNATVNDDTRTVVTSNPALKPQTADNYDLSAEYYFEPAGAVTAGVFRKDIKDFIYNAGGQLIGTGEDNGFGGQYAGYTVNTQANGGTGTVKGLEVSYTQQFTFLPRFWKGFGAFANGTWMKAEGNYGSGSAIGLAPTPKIAGFNPVNANAGVSYINNKLSVRVQVNHRGRYLLTFNANESRQIYARKRTTIGVKTSYRFTRQLEGYFDVVNLRSEPDREYEYAGGRARVYSMLVPQLFFGLNARL